MELSPSPSQGDKVASERRESDETLSDGIGGGEERGLVDNEVKKDSEMSLDVFRSSSKIGTQELTLSYMCDTGNGCVNGEKDDNRSNSFNFHEKELMEKVSVGSHKGKEVVVDDGADDCREDGGWVVERDFLSLSDVRANSSKRPVEEDVERDGDGDKKRKMETLNLSLALPDVSLSLNGGGGQNCDTSGAVAGQTRPRLINSVQALSNNNTQTSFSNDFTAASMSYSYSHPFSHNPSCSLTHNSTSNFEYSVGRESDQIWNCGEGTNGSVHSRFKPIGDGVGFANQGAEGFSLVQGGRVINKDAGNNHNNNSLHRAASLDNVSFLPSDLPARPSIDGPSENSRGKGSENLRVVESFDMGRVNKLSRPERILWEIVSDSAPVMTQIVQELTDEVVVSVKEYLKSLILVPDSDKKKELGNLQYKLKRRSDLTKETLSKANRYHLELLVSIKTGLASFLSPQIRLPTTELVEIFLLTRCRNVNCKSLLPVEDCDCKICSTNKGFCSSCMCPVCLQFDCASNTCSWVGCDMCSHWCHAACGIQRNLIRPSQSSKGPPGNTEMQFHCIGCDHASEMFGFVKDVFMCCAKDWGVETLKKEIDCVRKIFKGSEDFRGKQLQSKANESTLFELALRNLMSSAVGRDKKVRLVLDEFKYMLEKQIVLNREVQEVLLSPHRLGSLMGLNDTVGSGGGSFGDFSRKCWKVEHKLGSRKTIEWKPSSNKYLFAICTSGQMSNHLICLEKHMVFAALLNRVLVIPSSVVDYDYRKVLDIEHVNECVGQKAVVTFHEFSKAKKNHLHIDRFICYFSLPEKCYVDKEHLKSIRSLGISIGKIEPAWVEDITHPVKRTVQAVKGKFITDEDVIAIGDVFYADMEQEWVMQPGGPIAHKCKTLIEPSKLIRLTAQRFIQTFLGKDFVALHFRRHGFLKFCNAKEPSCFYPVPQAAECISRVIQRANAQVIYLSTDAADSETGLLESLLIANGKSVPLVKRPPRNSAEKWDALLYRHGLQDNKQVEAMLDKTLCAMATVFIGASGSTFTEDILRLRNDWGTASICDQYLCQGELPNFIAENA